MVCGQVWWPILGICALHLTHPSAHTHSSEHTPGAVGSQSCGARGAVGGLVPCSRVSPQSWYWRWRECWLFTPSTYNPCRTWDSNPQPSGYKSDSLSISPPLTLTLTYSWILQWINVWMIFDSLKTVFLEVCLEDMQSDISRYNHKVEKLYLNVDTVIILCFWVV